jgi:catechol-2,3-dioxygenase
METSAVSTDVNISRVLLRVSNIERATRFCHEVLGLRVVVYGPDFGLQAAFLAAGARQHFLLTTWDRPEKPRPSTAIGLPHVAMCYPTAWSFAAAVRLARRAGSEIIASWIRDGRSAIRLKDPDGNIIQLSYERRPGREFYDHDGEPLHNRDRASSAGLQATHLEVH